MKADRSFKIRRPLAVDHVVPNYSPFVGGAPVGAGCDDPQPTEGEQTTGAAGSPIPAAPVPPLF